MSRKPTEYHSVSFAVWKAPKRTLRFDAQGVHYTASDLKLDLAWAEIRAIVPAAVPVDTDEGKQDLVAALGIALHVPLQSPTLVGSRPRMLDYAVPLGDLARNPFLGLSDSPEGIFERAAEYAAEAGVRVVHGPEQI